ncbi:MAG: hypothetical protein ACI4KF_01250 [Huintestinicola sp.]
MNPKKATIKHSCEKEKAEFEEAFRRFLTLCASKNRKKNLAAGMIARDISRVSQAQRKEDTIAQAKLRATLHK